MGSAQWSTAPSIICPPLETPSPPCAVVPRHRERKRRDPELTLAAKIRNGVRLDCFAFARNDTTLRSRRSPTRVLPREFHPSKNQRAQGMPGVACARSLARKRKKRTSFSHRRSAETFRHSPRDCFNGLFRALPGEPGFLATITGGSSRQLDISVGISGPRDFTVCSPAVRLRTGAAPSHPALTSVTIAKRPFDWSGMLPIMKVIWAKREAKYFCNQDWTGQISLRRHSKIVFWRRGSKRARMS